MVDPKQATEAAIKFYNETTGSYPSMTLEEIELIGDYWHVTLGIPKGGLVYEQKDYKVFKVHATTGKVESMTRR